MTDAVASDERAPAAAPVRPERRWGMMALSICIAALMLSWPAMINRGVFVMPDTATYMRTADAAMVSLFGVRSVWSDRIDRYQPESGARPAPSGAASAPAVEDGVSAVHPPLLGRSIYYGMLVYLPSLVTGGEMASVLLQSALVAITLWLLVAMLFPALDAGARSSRYLAIALGLVVLTPAAYSTSLLMPDFLSGTTLVAFGLLLLFWARFTIAERVILGGVVVIAAMAHSSNLPLILGLVVVATGLRFAGAPIVWPAVATGLLAVLAGIGGDALFGTVVSRQLGVAPIRPPFFTARLIADGPGYDYAMGHCTTAQFEVCRYLDRLPRDSDMFLWSENPQDGVFSATDHRSQDRLASEDARFALATMRAYPAETARTSLSAFAHQATMLGMGHWRQSGDETVDADHRWHVFPEPVAQRLITTRSSNGSMPVEPVHTLTVLTLWASMAALVMLVAMRGSVRRVIAAPWLTFAIIVACGIIGNAFITGALSKPDARYNLRVVWVLPLAVAASVMAGEGRRLRRNRPPLIPDFSGAS